MIEPKRAGNGGEGNTMSLDITFTRTQPTDVASFNITHNLARMAREANIYHALWRPDSLWGRTPTGADIAPILRDGLARLEAMPAVFRVFDAPNGWGTYDDFVSFVRRVLSACEEFPDAEISVSV